MILGDQMFTFLVYPCCPREWRNHTIMIGSMHRCARKCCSRVGRYRVRIAGKLTVAILCTECITDYARFKQRRPDTTCVVYDRFAQAEYLLVVRDSAPN